MTIGPPTPKGTRFVQYSTRHMRLDLLDRVRTLAALTPRKTMEVMLLEALERGLEELERERLGRKRA